MVTALILIKSNSSIVLDGRYKKNTIIRFDYIVDIDWCPLHRFDTNQTENSCDVYLRPRSAPSWFRESGG